MPASPFSPETGILYHQGEAIAYSIRYGRPNRMRTTLRVMTDGRVEVLLPPGVPPAKGHAMLHQRTDWVVRQWQRFRQYRLDAPAPEQRDRRYVLGTLCRVERLVAHSWHGVTWRPPEFPNREGVLIFSSKSEAHAETLLRRWYAQKTLEVCLNRMTQLQGIVPWLKTPPPLRVRQFRSRWGSCSSQGVITLAALLCRLPVSCIDYVLLHELTHLAIFNHSPAFHEALAKLLPDWQTYRRRLETFPQPWQPETEQNIPNPTAP